MKKLLLIISFLITSHSFAQPGGLYLTEEQQEMKSLQLEFLTLVSPDTFNVLHTKSGIIAVLKDSIIPMGLISAPYYTDSAIINNYFMDEHWTQYMIKFQMKPKKTEKEKWLVIQFNDSILQLMKDLPQKLGIEHCRESKDMYYPKQKKDEIKIGEFEKEKQRLYDQLIPLPYFSTQYLDVYVMDDDVFDGYDQHPEWDGYYIIPSWANGLRWRIWDGVKHIKKRFEK